MKGSKAIGVIMAACLLCSCNKGGDRQSGDATIPDTPPVEQIPAGGQLPVTMTVRERSGVDRPDGFLEAGVPLARGEVSGSTQLRLVDGADALPAGFTPLAKWPDGSWRWVKVSAPMAMNASASRELTLERGSGPALETPHVELPPLEVELVAESGTSVFPVRESGTERRGTHGVEVDVEPLTDRRVRLLLQVAQLEGDDTWKRLSLRVDSRGKAHDAREAGAAGRGDWCASVYRAAERGPEDVSLTPTGFVIHLYPESEPPFPADAGFHVTFEIVFERTSSPDDLARRVAKPLRASFPPSYVDATRAMGRVGVPGPETDQLDRAFRACWDSIRAQQQLPRNRGWVAWGDFFDREHTLAYYGYLNQEYDPATAFFAYYARTGDAEALDLALDMARQYADSCVSLRGGPYQHRATLHAVYTCIADAIGEGLRERWRRQPNTPASVDEVVEFVRGQYGDASARVVREYAASRPESDSDQSEAHLSRYLGYMLVESASQDIQRDPSMAKRYANRSPTMRDMADMLVQSSSIRGFVHQPVDELFAPFFARYGGSWDDFPAFHFYDTPVERYTHDGSHSLAEMLVWGHLWTGDPTLRRAAMRTADYHVNGGLVQRAVDEVEVDLRKKRPNEARCAAWPLINLVALEVLTDQTDPALDAKIEQGMKDLAGALSRVPPAQYAGAIHMVVTAEALARYHEHTGNKEARRALIRLVRFWATKQWSREGFATGVGQAAPAGPAVTSMGLYGLAYAAWQGGDALLARRANEVLQMASTSEPSYVKLIAQQFRNSFRATGLVEDAAQ